jgi:SAM-dependent methyltransferase
MALFSAVICSETIEHIPRDVAALAEIARVLRPKGLLFVTVPNLWNCARMIQMLKTRDLTVKLMEGHVREYSPRQFKKLLSNWFTIERRVPIGFGWTGKYGGTIERLIHLGVLRRFCKSIAFVARKRLVRLNSFGLLICADMGAPIREAGRPSAYGVLIRKETGEHFAGVVNGAACAPLRSIGRGRARAWFAS